MTQSSQLPSQRTQPNAMDSRIKLCQLFAKHAKGMKHHWLHGFKDAVPSKIQSSLQVSEVGNYPVLDRTLGHKSLENARGTRFSLDFQALQEKCQTEGKQPSCRLRYGSS